MLTYYFKDTVKNWRTSYGLGTGGVDYMADAYQRSLVPDIQLVYDQVKNSARTIIHIRDCLYVR